MRQAVHDALAASTLTEARKRRIRDMFDTINRPDIGSVSALDRAIEEHLASAIATLEAEQAAEAAHPKTLLRAALDACFYGTPVPREGSARMGHAKDGWRHGVSRPFRVLVHGQPVTFDLVGLSPLTAAGPPSGAALDLTVQQYEDLVAGIAAGVVTTAP